MHKGCPHILQVFSPPPSPCPRLSAFSLATLLSLSVRTLTWRTKSCRNYGSIKTLLEKTCILYVFLICLFIFQSLMQQDDDNMTFKCPLLASRDYTGKDVHLQSNLLLPPVYFCPHCGSPLPSLMVWTSFMDAP